MTDRRREVRDAYDEIADGHDELRADSFPERELVADLRADLDDGARVLDAGCGAGEPVGTFLDDRCRVVGLDASRAQLDLAAERLPAAPLVQGDLTALPFASDAFDALCAIYSVIHVPEEFHRDCFAEFHRVCRDGAPALVTVGETDWTGSDEDWMGLGAAMHWEVPGVERATDVLEAVGFAVEDCEVVPDSVAEDDDATKAFLRARA